MKKTDLEKNKGLKIANRQAFDAARRSAGAAARGDARQADNLNPLMRRMLARASTEPAGMAGIAPDAANTDAPAAAPAAGKRARDDA